MGKPFQRKDRNDKDWYIRVIMSQMADGLSGA